MSWPELRLSEWRDTYDTLHMWLQVIGKVRLTCSPHANHWWETPLYVTARGLTTSAIPHGEEVFEIRLDFIEHRLDIETSGGERRTVPLVPMTVADFHGRVLGALRDLGIDVSIRPMPVEFAGAIPFDRDVSHASYDREHAASCWRALVAADKVLKEFGCRFTGKQSPAHVFWGSFDIALTRFSGRPAPPRPGADLVTREAYSHEVISVGWWPGAGAVDAAFYAYAAPEPAGFKERGPRDGAVYHDGLKEFLLPYAEARRRPDPKAAVLDFFQQAYDAGAELGGWDRAALDRPRPWPAV
jgi:hypothetical protein